MRHIKANDKRSDKRFTKSHDDFAKIVDKLLNTQDKQSAVHALDKQLLIGGTKSEIVDRMQTINKTYGYNHCKSLANLEKHITFRSERGWIYQTEGSFIKLVAFHKKAE